jgi:choline kinase
MKAIILAAGAGRRLGASEPKAMLDIGGSSIIHRQLAAFRAEGVDEFIVVVGYRQEQLREHLAGQAGRFTFVVNERYLTSNTIYSLYLAREHLTDAFYYANADVVFDRRLIHRLATAKEASVLAMGAGPCGDEEVKIIVRDGRIARIGKGLPPAEAAGEFLGVARFGRDLAVALTRKLALLVEGQGIIDDYFERAIEELCADRLLSAVEVTDLPCKEIDFPVDLELARREIAPRLL